MKALDNLGEYIVKNRRYFYAIAIVITLFSVFFFFFKTPDLSVEFKGGIYYDLSCKGDCIVKNDLDKKLEEILKTHKLQTSEKGLILKSEFLTQQKQAELEHLLQSSGYEILRSSSIGPSIGEEMRKKALIAIIIVVLSIIAFVAFAFRKVSKPVPSYVYGIIAIVALLHDILVPAGFYGLLGQVGAEIDTLFVVAMLAILGYSVNDTIVIFDRVRERLEQVKEKKLKEPFEQTVAFALQRSFARSMNTSFTTFLVLLSLYLFGPYVVSNFVLVLMVGVAAGTYSSIFLAAPLLVTYYEHKMKKQQK